MEAIKGAIIVDETIEQFLWKIDKVQNLKEKFLKGSIAKKHDITEEDIDKMIEVVGTQPKNIKKKQYIIIHEEITEKYRPEYERF